LNLVAAGLTVPHDDRAKSQREGTQHSEYEQNAFRAPAETS
jgi:hypothetical protein